MKPEQQTEYIVQCIREGGSMYEEGARQFLAEHDTHVRTEVLRKALAAVEGEQLRDGTNHPEDKAYSQAIDDAVAALNRLTGAEAEATPLVVSRFDTAMEPAPEEEQVFIVGAIAEDGRPVALCFDREDRRKVGGWLAPERDDSADETFFVAGCSYTRTNRHNIVLRFDCEHLTTDPQDGQREAWGWTRRSDGTRRRDFHGDDDYPNWTLAEAGDGRD